MKILIISDSHILSKNKIIELINRINADAIIHCGDIYHSYDVPLANHFYNVKGNNDFGDIPSERTITLDSLSFYICHGHRHYVESGTSYLEEFATKKRIDVVCFGHTHIPFYKNINNTIYINPGSLSYPRGKVRYPTYFLFDTTTSLGDFYNYETDEICNPFISTKKQSLFSKFFK